MLNKRLYPAIGLLTTSIIAFQLALMQILSFIQWSHFAYLIISIALLGFGASGTFISLFRSRLISISEKAIPVLMTLCGVTMGLTLFLTNKIFTGFDTFLLFNQPGQTWRLILICIVFMIPFFMGGTALGLIYTVHSSQAGKLYFFDLTGAGIGGAVFIVLLWIFFPIEIPGIIAFLPLVSAILATTPGSKKIMLFQLVFSAILILYFSINLVELPMSEFKSLRKTLDIPEAEVLVNKTSPYGVIHAVSAPSTRHAPGLSLAWQKPLPASMSLFNNGNWFGAIPLGKTGYKSAFYDYTLHAMPFIAGFPKNVLVLDAGTGSLASYCLLKGSETVTMVEPNAAAIRLLKNELAGHHDSLLYHPSLKLRQINSRSYLLSDTSAYDLIYLPDVESFGGSSGIYAARENYLLTVEAFRDVWNRLSEDGYMMVSVWMDYPLRAPLRLLAIIAETLKSEGIINIDQHLVLVRSWGNAGFLLKKSEFKNDEIQKIKEFCQIAYFDPVVMSSFDLSDITVFNILQDDNFNYHVDSIIRGSAIGLNSNYEFDITAPTDNKPYFFRFMKPSHLISLLKTYGYPDLAYMELGYFISFIAFFIILILTVILILLPLLFTRIKGKGIPFTLLYFSGLGIGFMFTEIVLIQQFILYLGEPNYSVAAVISGILLFSGTGSYFSGRLTIDKKSMATILLIIIPFIMAYAVGLRIFLGNTVHLAVPLKIVFTMLIIAPPSFFMGMAFPLGIRLLSKVNEILIPWAWGINGCFSVISAVLAIIISLHTGFQFVMLLAAGAYFISFSASLLPER